MAWDFMAVSQVFWNPQKSPFERIHFSRKPWDFGAPNCMDADFEAALQQGNKVCSI